MQVDNSITTAELSYTTKASVAGLETKVSESAKFKKDSSGNWIRTDNKQDQIADAYGKTMFETINLSNMVQNGRFKPELDYEVMGEEYFYADPLGYETKYEYEYEESGSKMNYFVYLYYEWNEYGYATKYEIEESTKTSGTRATISLKTSISVSYK